VCVCVRASLHHCFITVLKYRLIYHYRHFIRPVIERHWFGSFPHFTQWTFGCFWEHFKKEDFEWVSINCMAYKVSWQLSKFRS